MDNATLVNIDIDAGRQVIDTLNSAKIKVNVALWVLLSEYEDWRLVIASSSLDQSHPLKAYEQVAEILRDTFTYSRAPILILSLKDPFIKSLRSIFGKASSTEGMRLGGQTIGNRYISDAYVYQIR